MKKTYEVEMSSTTYRTFEVEAESPEDAQNIAFAQLDEDYEISKAWKQNAEVVFCEPQGGTSHMNDDEFGAYIRGEADANLDNLNKDL
jgi:hypothetical protein